MVRCSDGTPVVEAGAHRVWLVTWLAGIPIALLAHRPLELLRALGSALGELDSRLTGFDDPAVHRAFRWDLMQAPAILRLKQSLDDSRGRDLVYRRLRRFEAEVVPRLETLPFQVVHNDVNDHNVLVCRASGSGDAERDQDGYAGVDDFGPCGLLDFGDMMWTPRVCEPAIAIAYAMLGTDDPLASGRALLTGYVESVPLREDEIELIPELIEARLCVSVTISAYERRRDPDNPFVAVSETPAWRILDWLAEEPAARLGDAFAEAVTDRGGG